ncbi:MAG: SGNH/GDSL hydrolase family protein [Rickettsiales bacterium]|jgi:hypothetical protein|nr:SGNH/GDSL hydrolase family protein [Rickettsiales bacterium]
MCCDELKLELTRTLLELKSALEIIKILQEDESTKRTGGGRKSADESKLNLKDILMQNSEMEGEWTTVDSYRNRNSRRSVMRRPHWSIKNVNRYEALQNTDERITGSQNLEPANNRGMVAKKRKSLQRKKLKIVVVGDSYMRGIAGELLHNLGSAFEVIGYVKPGSGTKAITDTVKQEFTTLMKKDMVVVWGGANDIAKNKLNNGLIRMTNFVKLRKHTNVLLVSAPTRFDLSTAPCVNREVIAFNRKLYKRMKQFEHVKIIDSELHREYFTKHGMHMKIAGKEIMAQRTVEHIRETFSKMKTSTITLQWKQDIVKRSALS